MTVLQHLYDPSDQGIVTVSEQKGAIGRPTKIWVLGGAAGACSGLCAEELHVFQACLGEGVRIERVDHILAGARRRAYRVWQ